MKKTGKKQRKGSLAVALLLCLILAAGCLGGCGGSKEGQSQSKETQQSQSKETQQSEAEGQGETEGQEETSPLPLVAPGETATLNIGFVRQANIEDYVDNELTKWLKEQTGVDIEFTLFDQGSLGTQFSLMTADLNAKLPDILIYSVSQLPLVSVNQYGEDGYFIDLRPYMESEKAYWFKDWKESYSYTEDEVQGMFKYATDMNTDEMYVMPTAMKSTDVENAICAATINGKLLEAIGAEVPTTVDELCDVLRKAKNDDPNGNGKADEVPLLGSHGWKQDILEMVINAYVYDYPSYFFNVTDGKVWIPYTTDEYRQAMIKLNEMYAEGLISPLYLNTDNSTLATIYTPEDGVPICLVMGGHPVVSCFADSDMFADFKTLPPLKAETDKGGYGPMEATVVYDTLGSITESCEDPDLAFRFLDFFNYNFEACLHRRYGAEGVNWRWADEEEAKASGKQLAYVVLKDIPNNEPERTEWGALASLATDGETTGAVTPDGEEDFRGQLATAGYWDFKNAGQPDEVIHTLNYTDEEQTVISDYLSLLKDFVKARKDMFMTGELDPNDDAVWKEYVDAVEAQGASELIEAAQSAYDRSIQ